MISPALFAWSAMIAARVFPRSRSLFLSIPGRRNANDRIRRPYFARDAPRSERQILTIWWRRGGRFQDAILYVARALIGHGAAPIMRLSHWIFPIHRRRESCNHSESARCFFFSFFSFPFLPTSFSSSSSLSLSLSRRRTDEYSRSNTGTRCTCHGQCDVIGTREFLQQHWS